MSNEDFQTPNINLKLTEVFGRVFIETDQLYGSLHRICVTDHEAGITFEGAFLEMNLPNTKEVDLLIRPENRLHGPATGVTGEWSSLTETDAYTVSPPEGPTNPLKCTVRGNPQSPGGPADVGIVAFIGTRIASDGTTQPVNAQIAINVIPSGADIINVEVSALREQS